MAGFAEELRAARKAAGLSQRQLAEAVGITQGMVAHWETGRKLGVRVDTLASIERVLNLPAGALTRHLPPNHPARRMAATELPIVELVAAGSSRHEPVRDDETLRLSEVFAGCVVYRVRGDDMSDDQIRDGDYLVVRPLGDGEPPAGQSVVAWVEGRGYVVDRGGLCGTLKSTSRGHRRTATGRTLGVLVGVVRLCQARDTPPNRL